MNLRGASLILGSALVLALRYVGGRYPFLVGMAVSWMLFGRVPSSLAQTTTLNRPGSPYIAGAPFSPFPAPQ
jgi:hypothetical protein